MASCTDNNIRTFEQTRNFLQIPALDGRCGSQIIFYGDDCQYMEITGAQRNVRNASSPRRTWNKTSRSYCDIGATVSPPDIPAGTLRFYEGCGAGLPLPHMLGDCDIWAVVNHGLCKSQGDICDFQDYAEVYRLNVLSENRGRRTSFDGTDDPLINELNVEFLNVTDVTKIEFVDLLAEDAVAGNISADSQVTHARFLCESGCGQTVCGCQDSCNDGTQIMYFGMGTNVGINQIAWTVDGATIQIVDVPKGASLDFLATPIEIFNGKLYSLTYSDPSRFNVQEIDGDGNLGPIALVQTFLNSELGAPRDLQVCGNGDVLLILGTQGLFRFGAGEDGPTQYLNDPADPFNDMDCCGNTVVVVGTGGIIQRSTDGGRNFALVTAPTADNFFSVRVESADTFWVGTSGVAGGDTTYRTTDGGLTWTEIRPQDDVTMATIRSIEFNSDNLGYIGVQGGAAGDPMVYSTWLGGLDNDVWCMGDNRIGQFPDTFDVVRGVQVPECSNDALGANTVLVYGRNNGFASALIGRPQINYG